MKKRSALRYATVWLGWAWLLATGTASAQVELSGYVRDKSNGEALTGANVFIKETQEGTGTDEKGYFEIEIEEAGVYQLRISYIGYQQQTRRVELRSDKQIEIQLSPITIETEEVVVEAERADRNVTSTEVGKVELKSAQVEKLPAVLGEPDILRTVQLLPGVQTIGEGSSGIYVRGGGPDQNLILLDDGVVYNASHLLGFFSVFNPDAVEDFSLVKGGIPAEYGGRLSSVLDIKMKTGNKDSLEGSASVGLISSKLTLEGPIKEDTSSFIISGRRTYADILAQPFLNEQQQGNRYFFYDLNAKVDYRFNENNYLVFSGYYGRDDFFFKENDESSAANFDFGTRWGNTVAGLRWKHVFNDDLYSETIARYNAYDFEFTAGFGEVKFSASSGIEDVGLKYEMDWFASGVNEMKFGFETTYHSFRPGTGRIEDRESDITQEVEERYAWENGLYVQSNYSLSERLQLRAGLRYSLFNQVGPFDDVLFENEVPTGDTVEFSTLENVQFYDGLEPRLSARYTLDSNSSVKASFTRMNQYLHLATVSSGTLPTDIWIPSSKYVEPQRASQYSVGYFRNFADNTFEASVELYYKDMENQIDFAPDAEVFLNPNLDQEVLAGDGWAYGAEFFLKKRLGATTGWLGYTWSRTRRKIPGINDGEAYPPRYDRRHDFKMTLTHEFNEHWEGSMIFVYGTGIAYSLPTGRYFANYGTGDNGSTPADLISHYDQPVNFFRFPDYHRADISAIYTPRPNSDRWYQGSWNFSVYNVYNRKNPYFIFFDTDVEEGRNQAKMVYIFPILPSVSYSIDF